MVTSDLTLEEGASGDMRHLALYCWRNCWDAASTRTKDIIRHSIRVFHQNKYLHSKLRLSLAPRFQHLPYFLPRTRRLELVNIVISMQSSHRLWTKKDREDVNGISSYPMSQFAPVLIVFEHYDPKRTRHAFGSAGMLRYLFTRVSDNGVWRICSISII